MSIHGSRAVYNKYMRDYMRRRHQERHALAVQILGSRCSKCGSRRDLEVDHVDPRKKSFDINRVSVVAEERFLAEVKKCQLLCGRCHDEKSVLERGHHHAKGTHGTLSAYRWCGPPKCQMCKDAKARHQKEYRTRRAGSASGSAADS